MEETEIRKETEPAKRPIFLTVLCILTFISAGMGSLFSIITPLIADTMVEFLKSSPNYDEEQMTETVKVLQAGWEYYAPTFVFALMSLIGAILMWRLKKIGFHFYAASNLALLFLPMLLLGMAISWAGIFITIGFIAMYAGNLKYLS